MIAIGAGIAALACIGAGIGIGIATSKAAAIYGFVIGILIILFMA